MLANFNGIEVFNPTEIAGQDLGTILVLGGGRTVWTDYDDAIGISDNHEIMCVNDMACQFVECQINHAVSLHPKLLTAVRIMRIEKCMYEKITTHSCCEGSNVDVVWNMDHTGATSGLFAVKIALAMGFKKIIICGIPQDNSGHYYDYHKPKQTGLIRFHTRSNIIEWNNLFSMTLAPERVRALSGLPESIFGKPTKEWVNGSN